MYFSMVTQLLSCRFKFRSLLHQPMPFLSKVWIGPFQRKVYTGIEESLLQDKNNYYKSFFLPIWLSFARRLFNWKEVGGVLSLHRSQTFTQNTCHGLLGSAQALQWWGERVREGFADAINLGNRLNKIQNFTF